MQVVVTATMLEGYHPVIQAALGTFLTWGLTAAGSALVFVFESGEVNILTAGKVLNESTCTWLMHEFLGFLYAHQAYCYGAVRLSI